MIDLDGIGVAVKVAKTLAAEVDSWSAWKYDEGPRRHLGGSKIGDPCHRALWFGFRWCSYKIVDGRQRRLWQRGHWEEPHFVSYLEGIGCTVKNTGDNQQSISDHCGHFGGSLDGEVILPERYDYNVPLLLEFKTNKTGAGFNNLIANGCKIEKPIYYDQQNVYGFKAGYKHSLFGSVNKNDDSIHWEIIKLDLKRGEDLVKKAGVIIFSQTAPQRISEHPTAMACKMCDFIQVCHFNKPLDINCRSCKNAKPVESKQWFCLRYEQIIPDEVIRKGCSEWTDIRNQ